MSSATFSSAAFALSLSPFIQLTHCLDLDIPDQVSTGARMETILHHEQGLSCGGVDMVVVGKLSDREPVDPVILVLIDEHLEEGLEVLVDLLHLAIGLWMICCRWGCLYA